MSSLADIDRLLGMSAWRQHRGERELQAARQRLVLVQRELAAMDEHEGSLRALLGSHRAENRVLDHWQLLETLRRQAVIRRQIQLLALERGPLHEQRVQLDQVVHQAQQGLLRLRRKHVKYVGLRQRLGREYRLAHLRRDEGEIEDLTGMKG
ncbi:protein SpaM [Pseudomonas gingeri]|uniref:protein SpaM n=1 Tax=Pseudomonas gingeri TaxID=117681 RepID=UPI0015A4E566|nr:protein SpaM [Pseudomonas gingeri]NVZ99854.1 protein SpaM [Pseudomonas gingeri]NWA16694.1 protein SpaM [Pseudomonas gingeri]NWA53920.1 protein SpaM [Pseudomonas gingeri]NWA94152.1 protein SpaM [Pseudomonas gingeri]NWB01948.1 protein SpaM [Pseudomonas gingeri]